MGCSGSGCCVRSGYSVISGSGYLVGPGYLVRPGYLADILVGLGYFSQIRIFWLNPDILVESGYFDRIWSPKEEYPIFRKGLHPNSVISSIGSDPIPGSPEGRIRNFASHLISYSIL